ncbi:1-deoxy-D-xylulose-5-phosphate synthase [Myroides sp. LJL119]
MSKTLLKTINTPEDLKQIPIADLPVVAKELRDFIIDIVATKQGHLGASLGVVELTIALHYVFNTPEDLLIWDVGHQAYGHKLLTGRKDRFNTNRTKDGISGFPKPSESVYDPFGVGHSSTAISATLGMAIASKLNKEFDKDHIAVVGDASIASGMAFEGLNHAGVSQANILVILNDNAIGIDPSVGALKQYLTNVKLGKNPKVNNMIKSLNFDYTGPIDGHDLPKLIAELKRLKKKKGARFLHIITTKGKGLKQAELDQVKYHAPGKFDSKTGEIFPKTESEFPSKYQDVFGHTLVELAKENEKIVGITAAMPTGTSLKYFMQAFPDRGIDVGIAEQHAVTLAAGMATQGLIPFVAIYSTFLQRAYDQVIHDVALQNLPVIFCMDRAGLVGEDGPTHHGVFDIAYLNCIPNMTIACPLNELELRNLLYFAQSGIQFPLAIRYPRGKGVIAESWEKEFEKITIGCVKELQKGDRFAILSTGTIGNNIIEAFKESNNTDWSHYHFMFVKPLNEQVLGQICQEHQKIVTFEDGVISGGFGSAVASFVAQNYPDVQVEIKGIQDEFIEHATVLQQQEHCFIDTQSIVSIIN